MKSVRLDAELENYLKQSAKLTGKPESVIIREAIRKHCDSILANRLDLQLADLIGSVASGGGNSRDTGREFTDIVEEKLKRRRRL